MAPLFPATANAVLARERAPVRPLETAAPSTAGAVALLTTAARAATLRLELALVRAEAVVVVAAARRLLVSRFRRMVRAELRVERRVRGRRLATVARSMGGVEAPAATVVRAVIRRLVPAINQFAV